MADKKINLYLGIILKVKELFARLTKDVGNNVLVDCALVNAQVTVDDVLLLLTHNVQRKTV